MISVIQGNPEREESACLQHLRRLQEPRRVRLPDSVHGWPGRTQARAIATGVLP